MTGKIKFVSDVNMVINICLFKLIGGNHAPYNDTGISPCVSRVVLSSIIK